MKITGLETIRFHSRHRNVRRNWLLIKLLTEDAELFGIGEASSLGLEDEVEGILRWWIGNYLQGKDPLDSEVHWTRMYHDINASGGPPARSGTSRERS